MLKLQLLGSHGHASLLHGACLLDIGTRLHAVGAAIVCNAGDVRVVVNYCRVVHVVHNRRVHVRSISVVVVVSSFPATTIESISGIAITVIDSAIESDYGSPITGVPQISAIRVAPVSWRPKKSNLGRHHPRSRYPVVPVRLVIRPKTRLPKITRPRAQRLFVHRQRWGPHPYRHCDSHLRFRGSCVGL